MSGFQFKTIKSEWFPLRVLIAAEPSGGKTLSAIKLGLGLAHGDGRKVFFLDTDAGRGAALYGQELEPRGIQYAKFDPPFSPSRFGEGIEAAESAGAEVLIIDCVSDELEGPGGLASLAEADKGSWLRPKNQHFIKFINRSNISYMHIIFTVIAKTVSMPEKEMAKFRLQNASKLAAPDVSLVCEKSFTKPMTVCLFVARGGQEVSVFKAHSAIEPTVAKITAPITEEHGALLRRWADGNLLKALTDEEFKPDLTVEKYKTRFKEIVENGAAAVEDGIAKTPADIKEKLGEAFFADIRTRAAEYDRLRAEAKTDEPAQ